MAHNRKILLISPCTAKKRQGDFHLSYKDFKKGPEFVEKKQKEVKKFKARDLYLGLGHKLINQAIDKSELDIDWFILSAGYGFVEADKKIAPYDVSFKSVSNPTTWSEHLQVPQLFREMTRSSEYDFGFILLGKEYLDACQISMEWKPAFPICFMGTNNTLKKLPKKDTIVKLMLTRKDCTKYGASMINLKGAVMAAILEGREDDPFK